MLDKIADKTMWENFYDYKTGKENTDEEELSILRDFIDGERYVFWGEKLKNRNALSHPKKVMINKSKAGRKRVVYVFSQEENCLLKFVSFLLREYDFIFAPDLYSFRKYKTVKSAINRILSIDGLDEKYVYKVDVSGYFNSVNVSKLLPVLEKVLENDREMYLFFEDLLLDPLTVYNEELISENKGILPGVPVSAFLANLYLRELDFYFYNNNIPYVRYSDDILVFADNEADVESYSCIIKRFLNEKDLQINPDKEIFVTPHQKWEFLGFSYHNGVVDISDTSFKKIKAKMRRKTKALLRWADKKSLPGEYAARAFVKRFNAKMFDNHIHNDLTWARWYFPVINTTATLKLIDEYMQDCIRVLAGGKRTKSKYNFRYENIKALGYRNLVNEYYKIKSAKQEEAKKADEDLSD